MSLVAVAIWAIHSGWLPNALAEEQVCTMKEAQHAEVVRQPSHGSNCTNGLSATRIAMMER